MPLFDNYVQFLFQNLCLHVHTFCVIPIPVCNSQIHIYFLSSVFRTSNLDKFYIIYTSIPASPSSHIVKGEGCIYSISAIAGSNPDDFMDVRLFCFVLCCEGSCLCDGLITAIEESYRVCLLSRASKNEVSFTVTVTATYTKQLLLHVQCFPSYQLVSLPTPQQLTVILIYCML